MVSSSFTRPEPDGPGHVALYAGGGRVVAASRPGTLIHELSLASQGTVFGWARYIGATGHSIGMQTFGASAPLKELLVKFGFTGDNVYAAAKAQLARRE